MPLILIIDAEEIIWSKIGFRRGISYQDFFLGFFTDEMLFVPFSRKRVDKVRTKTVLWST
jgi:hypothetical protein